MLKILSENKCKNVSNTVQLKTLMKTHKNLLEEIILKYTKNLFKS